ncbi:4-hydroxybenzoate polyprenyltransferase, mitochondrial-like [Cyclospora cayetanensis]|uniref:4-hydroxybenzoate polyprenyltransferase, mitochondrial n=1 Tax=Cyclospora cayetanensis TaxID=88456 RepID=A0A6P6S3Y5_9EIME|nr:4-hydroxybenzoate polyprenyltransferase, mitochondrial-like [Cyclospora cayetanensis]
MLGAFQRSLRHWPLSSIKQCIAGSRRVPALCMGAPKPTILVAPSAASPPALFTECRFLSVDRISYSTPNRACRPEGPSCSKQASQGSLRNRNGPWWAPYASLVRLHAPVGTWLLYWPCVFSICLATPVSAGGATAAAAKAAVAQPSAAALIGAAAWGTAKLEGEQEQQDDENAEDAPSWMPSVWRSALSSLCLCGVGALLMRSAGCVVNDLWDRKLDRGVERTRKRPLASGTLGVRGALGALGALLVPSLGVLLQFNEYAVGTGLASLLFVAVYPSLKRIFALPQLFLGITFSWGALFGWAAILGPYGMPSILGGSRLGPGKPSHGTPLAVEPLSSAKGADESIPAPSPACAPSSPSTPWFFSSRSSPLLPVEWTPVWLYVGCALWTLTYDTLYAFQDVRDDKKMGIRSSALTWGPRGTRLWGSLAILAQGVFWTLAGAPLGVPEPYYIGVLYLGNGAACARAFAGNHRLGALFAASIVASKILEYLELCVYGSIAKGAFLREPTGTDIDLTGGESAPDILVCVMAIPV